MRMISVSVETPNASACNLVLRAPRVFPDSARIFQLAKLGDVVGMTTLFEQGLASVYDVDTTNGVSALNVSS